MLSRSPMTPRNPTEPRACTGPGCVKTFIPFRPMQSVCGPVCARRKVEAAKKQERTQDREKREKLKRRKDWLDECQTIVNKYVRLRDRHLGCCSCDKPATWDGQWHASHFRSVGAASAIRFHLWNIAKSCSVCNNHLSGNLASYRPRMIKKLGEEKVAWLDSQNQVVRYDIVYLKRLKAVMAKKVRRLEKRIAMFG